jgi:hypothetical protein
LHHFNGKHTASEVKETGSVVQLVRMPPCHGGGRGFESRPDRKGPSDSSEGPFAFLPLAYWPSHGGFWFFVADVSCRFWPEDDFVGYSGLAVVSTAVFGQTAAQLVKADISEKIIFKPILFSNRAIRLKTALFGPATHIFVCTVKSGLLYLHHQNGRTRGLRS